MLGDGGLGGGGGRGRWGGMGRSGLPGMCACVRACVFVCVSLCLCVVCLSACLPACLPACLWRRVAAIELAQGGSGTSRTIHARAHARTHNRCPWTAAGKYRHNKGHDPSRNLGASAATLTTLEASAAALMPFAFGCPRAACPLPKLLKGSSPPSPPSPPPPAESLLHPGRSKASPFRVTLEKSPVIV